MKYLHIYNDNTYCESKRFKNNADLILTDEEYSTLTTTHEIRNGKYLPIAHTDSSVSIAMRAGYET